jgi:hypothetical protein
VYDEATADAALVEIRRICLALPEVTERLSHGSPTFFISGKKTLAMSSTTTTRTVPDRLLGGICATCRHDARPGCRGERLRSAVVNPSRCRR